MPQNNSTEFNVWRVRGDMTPKTEGDEGAEEVTVTLLWSMAPSEPDVGFQGGWDFEGEVWPPDFKGELTEKELDDATQEAPEQCDEGYGERECNYGNE